MAQQYDYIAKLFPIRWVILSLVAGIAGFVKGGDFVSGLYAFLGVFSIAIATVNAINLYRGVKSYIKTKIWILTRIEWILNIVVIMILFIAVLFLPIRPQTVVFIVTPCLLVILFIVDLIMEYQGSSLV